MSPSAASAAARLLLAAIALASAGCAADPMRSWQKALETYVIEEGNGDPVALRALDRNPAESDFTVFGASTGGVRFFFPTRTDANGELVGYEPFDGRSWWVFLVGMVEYSSALSDFPTQDPRLVRIQPAAVSVESATFDWLVGEPDEEALQRYRAAQLEAWRRSHPDRADAAEGPTTFPTEWDVLRVEVGADGFTVIDEHSGGRWEMEGRSTRQPVNKSESGSQAH